MSFEKLFSLKVKLFSINFLFLDILIIMIISLCIVINFLRFSAKYLSFKIHQLKIQKYSRASPLPIRKGFSNDETFYMRNKSQSKTSKKAFKKDQPDQSVDLFECDICAKKIRIKSLINKS